MLFVRCINSNRKGMNSTGYSVEITTYMYTLNNISTYTVTFTVQGIYVTVNCGNQALPGMPEIFRQYWECL